MNYLLLFVLFSVSFLHAMSLETKLLLEKYKDLDLKEYYKNENKKIEDEEFELTAQIFGAQASANIALFIVKGALPTIDKSTKVRLYDHPVLRTNHRNANQDRFKNSYPYILLNMISSILNISLSLPISSEYLADAYENRNNLTKSAGNACMGTGLAINSLVISAGGASNLTSNKSVKNTLNIVSTGATAMETFKHVRQAYNLWDKDWDGAKEHMRYAGLFTFFGAAPFILDHYQKKVTQ